MKKICILLIMIMAICSRSYASTPCHQNEIHLFVKKRVVVTPDKPYYKYEIIMPLRTNAANIEQAATILASGLDKNILHMASKAFKDACGVRLKCDYTSIELWDDFYTSAVSIKIEGTYSLQDYLSAMHREIGSYFGLELPCITNNNLCLYVSRKYKTGYEIYGELIFRKVLLNHLNISPNENDLFIGFGDYVSKN